REGTPLMRIQRASSDAFECPKLTSYHLPVTIMERATDGLCWISIISAVSSVALTIIEHLFQPEFAAAWTHPVLRLTSLSIFFLSIAFIAIQRSGVLSTRRLLDLGMLFQVAVAFAGGLFEGAAYQDPDAVVIGISGIAVWMMLSGRLMPNAPLK